jgi:hypothetical protein
MDMTNIMYELINTKTSLAIADRTIKTLQKQNRRLNRRCLRQSLMIAGLTWLTVTACRMLSENNKKRKEAEEDARQLHAELAHTQQVLDDVNRKNAKQFWTEAKKDICCDGKATITKNPE